MVGPLVHVCTLFLRKPVAFREFFLAEAHDGLLGPEQIVRLIERLDEALSVDDAAAIAAQLLEHAGGAPRVSLSRLSAVADATVQRARARAAFWSAARKVCLLIFVYLPLLAAALAAGFGALLALVEGWSYADSFWVVLAELSMTTIEIVETEAPDSDLGRVAGCIVGALQLAIFEGLKAYIISSPGISIDIDSLASEALLGAIGGAAGVEGPPYLALATAPRLPAGRLRCLGPHRSTPRRRLGGLRGVPRPQSPA